MRWTLNIGMLRPQPLRVQRCGRVSIATMRTGSLRKEFKKILRKAWQVARIMLVEMI